MAKGSRTITPVGVARYPSLFKPNKFDAYEVHLLLEGSDAQKLMTIIDKAHKDSVELAKEETGKKKVKVTDPPYQPEEDDDGNETGRIIFKFRKKAITAKGKPVSPPLVVDSENNRMSEVQVWSGSKIRVSVDLNPYYVPALGAGVSLRLIGVQIKELIQSADSVDSLGFDELEEGYLFEEEEKITSDATKDNESDEEEEDEEDF